MTVIARPFSGGLIGHRYELKSQAGSGGMGTVYRALDLRTRASVAVKVLHGKNESDLGRFVQEAQMLAELGHPAIVRFIERGTTDHGEQYLVMEWLDGETLEARLNRGALTPSLTARLAVRVCEALAVAHGQGIVHRDIKPSNIFLANYRIADAKVLDFGVARRTFDPKRFTKKGSTVGTPMYTAPEQARAEREIDGRADLFSLGCVLYECLCREPAFTGDSPAEVMTKICIGEIPVVADRLPDVDRELATTIQGMLRRSREERPRDAGRLATVFSRMADRLAPEERPVPADDVRRPAQRRPARDALSQNEQKIMTVLVLASIAQSDDHGGGTNSDHPAGNAHGDAFNRVMGLPSSPFDDVTLNRIATAIEPFGGRLDRLLDRSLIITAPAFTTIDEQTFQIGRIALELARREPRLALALATGRGVLLARLPTGEVIEQAATLLDGAPPGVVMVDRVSAGILHRRFRLQSNGEDVRLVGENFAGMEIPAARVWWGMGAAERISPFIGRDRELASVQDVYQECLDEAEPRAMVVTGGPGIGKTRFAAQALSLLNAHDVPPMVVWGRGRAILGLNNFVALHDIVTAAGITQQDSYDMEKVLHKWRAWIGSQTRRQPLVLLVEDAHLADPSSLQLLDATVRELDGCPVLILLVARPEFTERFSLLFAHRSPERLRLAPLPPRHAEAMVRALLPRASTEIVTWVLRRASGNPTFIEQLVQSAQSGLSTKLPIAVAGVVQGMLGGLNSDAKRVLRAASIYGETCTRDSLQALVGGMDDAVFHEALSVLEQRGLLEKGPKALDLSQVEYRMRDPLLREAVFMTLARGDRALGRRLARQYLEESGQPLPETLYAGGTVAELSRPAFSALGLSAEMSVRNMGYRGGEIFATAGKTDAVLPGLQDLGNKITG